MIDVLPVAREPEYHDRCSTSSLTARLDNPTPMISVPALSSPFILLMLPVTRRVPLSSRSSPATFSPSSVPFRRWSSHVLRFVVPVFHHPSIGGRPYYDANGCKLPSHAFSSTVNTSIGFQLLSACSHVLQIRSAEHPRPLKLVSLAVFASSRRYTGPTLLRRTARVSGDAKILLIMQLNQRPQIDVQSLQAFECLLALWSICPICTKYVE
jgi:hypothetical protein